MRTGASSVSGRSWTRPATRRWLTGWLVSVVLVAAVSGGIQLLQPHVPVPSLLALYLLAVVPVAVVWGAWFAVLASLLSGVAFVFLFSPPRYSYRVDHLWDLFALGIFLVISVVVGELATRWRRQARRSARLSEEQAALRRVATLVARSVSPSEVFAAVTREVGLLCRADMARMERYEADGTVTGVAGWGRVRDELAVGTQFTLEGVSVAAQVRQSAGPVRVQSFDRSSGPIAREAQRLGIRSSVGCPIVVAGRLWGVIAASSKNDAPFPKDTESRIADFTDLVATAIANAESRAELDLLLDQQAALRRVATLVARGLPSAEIFAAVAEEVGRLTGADATIIVRLDPDGVTTIVAKVGEHPKNMSLGRRWKIEPPLVLAEVLRTGSPGRRDDFSQHSGEATDIVDWMGLRSSVGIPIVVEGRLWGGLAAGSRRGPFLADTEPRMADFAELVGIAIANAQHRAEVAASRARVVAASDEARRRIERNLHDGAQQRLVSMGFELRLTEASVPADLPTVRAAIGQAADEITDVVLELREMSRGIHPAVLSEGGLGPALQTLARRSLVPVEVDMRTESRFPEPAEAATYYVVSEALTNTTKHACASRAHVAVEERAGFLCLSVRDDGVGGADPEGSGLIGLRDRVEALGGSIEVSSRPGEGTLIQVALPVGPA
jgi:signal transduction histidine kinase